MDDARTTLEGVLAAAGATLASDAEVARWERRRAADARSELLSLSGVGEVLSRVGSELVIADKLRDTDALRLVQRWIASSTPALVLFGGKGLGKTVAAAWALSRVPGRYVEAATLCAMHRGDYGNPSEDFFRHARGELLVIDELGCEANIEHAIAALHDAVNRRQRLPRRTLLLGNLDREALIARYDARTLDRLQSFARFRAVTGESMREAME